MLKKIILSGLLGVSSFLFANVNAVVSVVPEQTFLQAIGGDKVNISLMVQSGSSPHTYEPKPSQMQDISKADVYFSIGVEFEDAWLPRFIAQNKKMQIVYVGEGIKKIAMEKHTHAGEQTHKKHEHKAHGKDHDGDGLDPHIWAGTSNAKVIAKNMFNSLVKLDSRNSAYYKVNYEKFLKEIENTDKQIKEILKNTKAGSKFMVFHPSWGYFAKDYGLVQFAIEAGGKNPSPKQIAYLIKEAKEEGVKAVFTAPEFSEKVAMQIAKEVGIPVIKVSPLNPKWSENLIGLAKAIAKK
jgi:zinc transport system substrate-binding protein